MENESEKQKGNSPAFSGEGITIWVNKKQDGEPYLTVQLFGKNGIRVNAWKVKPRLELVSVPESHSAAQAVLTPGNEVIG